MGKKSRKGQQHHAAHEHHKAGQGTHGHHHYHSGAWYNAHHKDKEHEVVNDDIAKVPNDDVVLARTSNNTPPSEEDVNTETTKDLQEPLLANNHEEPETEMTPKAADRGIDIPNEEKKTSDDLDNGGINHYHGYTVNGREIAAINDHYVTSSDDLDDSADGVCGCFEKCTIM